MSHLSGNNRELVTNFQAQFVLRRLLFLDSVSLHKWSQNKEHGDFFYTACVSVRQSVSKDAREGRVSQMLTVLLSDTRILQGSDVQDLLL